MAKRTCRRRRLRVRDDAVGNIFIRWAGAEPDLPAVATGSHTDAIPHAGMYDGTVGVLGGLEAMRALKRGGLRPRRSIELVMFTSEEPTRFGIGCIGSRLMSGTLDPQRADTLREANEPADTARTLAQVRTAAGFSGSLDSVKLPPNHYHAWIELHIEQGPLLEREGIPLGIVTSIAAPASYRFTITGLGGHAGALLMPDRKDALCAAAELILSVEKHALATGAIDTVATVGTCVSTLARSTAFPAASSCSSIFATQTRIAARPSCRPSAATAKGCANAARSRSPKSWSTPTPRPNAPRTLSSYWKISAKNKGSRTKKWSAAPTMTRSSWPASHPSLWFSSLATTASVTGPTNLPRQPILPWEPRYWPRPLLS